MNLNDIPLKTLSCSNVYEITDGPNKGKLGVFIGDLQFVTGDSLTPGEEEHILVGMDHICDVSVFEGVLAGTEPGGDLRFEDARHLRYRGYVSATYRWVDRRP